MAVAVGAVVGSGLRQLTANAMPAGAGEWPLATLMVNLSGALLLGLLIGWMLGAEVKHASAPIPSGLARAETRQAWLRSFLAVGVLGSFTTFSALSVEVSLLIDDGDVLGAGAYLVSTVCGGLLCAWAGLALARRIRSRGRSR